MRGRPRRTRFAARQLTDCGVAGLHRLLAELDTLVMANAVVVVAGMEGALASVVGGLTPAPVVAVPTSTGYGAALEGVTALRHALRLLLGHHGRRYRQRLRGSLRHRVDPPVTQQGSGASTLAWFHCFAGIAGDMALGSLVDAGADVDEVRALLNRLPLPGWHLEFEDGIRGASPVPAPWSGATTSWCAPTG